MTLECMLAEMLGPCPHPSTLALIMFVQGEEWFKVEPFTRLKKGGACVQAGPNPTHTNHTLDNNNYYDDNNSLYNDIMHDLKVRQEY